jgi:hypothetical protein
MQRSYVIGERAMTGYTKLAAPLEHGGEAELLNLARRSNTSAKRLGELAVRQLLVAARTGALPELPALDDTANPNGVYVWLSDTDKAALDELAEGQITTPEALASLAVRHLLAQARNGALPMLKPPELAEPTSRSLEELAFDRNGWSFRLMNDSDTPEELRINFGSMANEAKASFTMERLERLAGEGIDPANPRTILDQIDKLVTVKPLATG